MRTSLRTAVLMTLILAACATDSVDGADNPSSRDTSEHAHGESTTSPTTDPDAAAPPDDVPGAEASLHIADAVAINLASLDDRLVVGWKDQESVRVEDVDLDGGQIFSGTVVSGDTTPFAHYLERPTLAIEDDGTVVVAYTAVEDGGGSVYLSSWSDEATTGPDLISGEPLPETNLVHLILDSGDRPILAWLEDSTLSVATGPSDDLPSETELVDDLTCDCCNPSPILIEDGLVVAYRNLERDGADVIRDVYALRSDDGGQSFAEPVLIADDKWFLDACPFSGPSVVNAGGSLLVAWMDARQSVHPEQQSTTIWVDRSNDGGRTFGTDLPVAAGAFHRWPAMAVDDSGTVHLVWETQGPDGGIFYSQSVDGGVSFAEPHALVPNTDDSGNRNTPSLMVHGDNLALAWVDRRGGHIALFAIDGMGD
jgi:hypothetical protein